MTNNPYTTQRRIDALERRIRWLEVLSGVNQQTDYAETLREAEKLRPELADDAPRFAKPPPQHPRRSDPVSDPVTLTVWRNAKTDPPETDDALCFTDGNPPYLRHVSDEDYYGWVFTDVDGIEVRARRAPKVWCDPVPPADDPLTLDDLNLIALTAMFAIDQVFTQGVKDAVARLRKTLEEGQS